MENTQKLSAQLEHTLLPKKALFNDMHTLSGLTIRSKSFLALISHQAKRSAPRTCPDALCEIPLLHELAVGHAENIDDPVVLSPARDVEVVACSLVGTGAR